MIDLKKIVEISKRMDGFLNGLSDSSKNLYLISFAVIINNMMELTDKLGVLHEFYEKLKPEEKMALASVDQFMREIMKIRGEVLDK